MVSMGIEPPTGPPLKRIPNMYDLKFIALNRETELAKRVTCSGLTALRKANPSRPGLYYDAFFGISIGIERLAKLAWLIDERIASGTFPTDDDLKKKGHNIRLLLDLASAIRLNRKCHPDVPSRYTTLPDDPISTGIINFLSDFAKVTRYFNIDFITGGKSIQMGDPIKIWHSTVGVASSACRMSMPRAPISMHKQLR
jgi:hypothetical protein